MAEKIVGQVSPEEAERKQKWLQELAEFIVAANRETWVADKGKVEATRPEGKRHLWSKGDWTIDDEFDSYFKAPGETKIFYKNRPVWSIHYGGPGMTEGYEHMAKETYAFLRNALLKDSPELPYRGPEEYLEGGRIYRFRITRGNLEDCSWEEEIEENGVVLFRQIGFAGTHVGKDENRQPVYPWNF